MWLWISTIVPYLLFEAHKNAYKQIQLLWVCFFFFLCTHNSNTSEIQYSQMITWRRIQTSMRPNGIFAILCRVRAFLVRLCDNDHHQPIAYTHTHRNIKPKHYTMRVVLLRKLKKKKPTEKIESEIWAPREGERHRQTDIFDRHLMK